MIDIKCIWSNENIDDRVNSKDLVSLANSVHAVTLLELNVTLNDITSGSAAGGLITLCHNLTNIKVLMVVNCSLHTLSSQSVAELVNAFKGCTELQVLEIYNNPFSLENTTIIIEGNLISKDLVRRTYQK